MWKKLAVVRQRERTQGRNAFWIDRTFANVNFCECKTFPKKNSKNFFLLFLSDRSRGNECHFQLFSTRLDESLKAWHISSIYLYKVQQKLSCSCGWFVRHNSTRWSSRRLIHRTRNYTDYAHFSSDKRRSLRIERKEGKSCFGFCCLFESWSIPRLFLSRSSSARFPAPECMCKAIELFKCTRWRL